MNKVYRVIKNKFTGTTSVAHELAKSHGGQSALKKSVLSLAVASVIAVSGAGFSTSALANSSYYDYHSVGNGSGANLVFDGYTNLGPTGWRQYVYSNSITTSGATDLIEVNGVRAGLQITGYVSADYDARSYVGDNSITNNHAISINTDINTAGILISSYAQSYVGYNTARADVYNNTITNNGAISVSTLATYAHGIAIMAGARGDETAQAYAIGNTITNNANITADSVGILISADAYSNYGYSHADVMNNTITNSAAISAGGGIVLRSYAYGEDSVHAHVIGNTVTNTAKGTITGVYGIGLVAEAQTYNSSSDAQVDGNTITNRGIIASMGPAIVLRSYASGNWGYGEGSAGYAATATVSTNTILNTGTIVSAGYHGIDLIASSRSYYNLAKSEVNGNHVTNTGKITGEDHGIFLSADAYTVQGDAIANVENNRIVNAGTITAGWDGIRLHGYTNIAGDGYGTINISHNEIINTGTIHAGGTGIALASYGEDSCCLNSGNRANLDHNTIVNNGKIDASNWDGIAIWGYTNSYFGTAHVTNNTIINNGTINAYHNGLEIWADSNHAYGEDFVTGNTITNTGSIVAGGKGINVYSSYWTQNNIINNSGKVVSKGTYGEDAPIAIYVGGTSSTDRHDDNLKDNTLNLSAPAFIGGHIQLEQSANVNVNLTSGVSHSNHWTFDTYDNFGPKSVTTSGPTPWFVRNGAPSIHASEFSTIDPTAFANAPSQIADTTRMVSAMNKFGLDKDLTDGKPNVWLNIQGEKSIYDGNNVTTGRQVNRLYGISAGYSAKLDDKTTYGGLIGYNRNELAVNSRWAKSFDNTTDGAFVGIFGRTKAAQYLSLDYALNAGFNSHDEDRFVNDNLYSMGISHAKSSYNSYWIAPEATVSLPYEVTTGLTLAPSLNVRFTQQHLESYTESGSDSNASVASRDYGIVESKLGLGVTQKWAMASVGANVSYLYRDLVGGDNSVDVSMIGDKHAINFDYRKLSAGVLGLDAKINLSKDVMLQATGNYIHGTNVNGGNVMGSIKFAF